MTVTIEQNPIAWADAEIQKHKQAIADLEAWKRVELSKRGAKTPDLFASPNPTPTKLDRPKTPVMVQIGRKKRVMLQAIADSQNGLSTQQVIAACNAAGFPDQNAGNYSPQLSGYKSRDQYLTLVGGAWHITDKGRAFLASAANELGGEP